jgi:hypothetical protein
MLKCSKKIYGKAIGIFQNKKQTMNKTQMNIVKMGLIAVMNKMVQKYKDSAPPPPPKVPKEKINV